MLTQRGRRCALSSDLPICPLNRGCQFELQAWGTIAHRGPRGEGWLLAGRGFRIILIDLSAPFSTFRISSSRAFDTFLPVQLYMIPAGQATPACTDLIDLSRLRVNLHLTHAILGAHNSDLEHCRNHSYNVPVLRIQVDLKCTGILFLPVYWMGGGHVDLSSVPLLLKSEFHVTTLLAKVLHGNLPYS